jgi:hypothetical protein
MPGRAFSATLTVTCLVAGCQCERQIPVLLYTEAGGLVEHPYEKECPACSHPTMKHGTKTIEKHGPVERRTKPRE